MANKTWSELSTFQKRAIGVGAFVQPIGPIASFVVGRRQVS